MQLLISPEKRAELIRSFHPGTKRGLIKMIVIIVIGIIVLSVLGFDIRAAVEHPQTQTNFSFIGELIANTWNNYFADAWAVIWKIAGPGFEFIWQGAQDFEWSEFNSQQSDFIQNVPSVNLDIE